MQDKLDVIIIEKSEFFRDFLVKSFNRDSRFNATGVFDYKEFREKLKSNEYHLIVADGDENGAYEFAKGLRSEKNSILIMLYFDSTGTGEDILKKIDFGIDSGIDCIATKPIQMVRMRNAAAECIWKYLKRENFAFQIGRA